MKTYYLILVLAVITSCNIKESLQAMGEEKELEENVQLIDPNNKIVDWEFMGVYTGTKEESYDQNLTYKLYLWEKENNLKGYFYFQWYVTDFNYSENHSLVSGKVKEKSIQLKGTFDNEPFIISIKDSIAPEFNISIRYPTNFSSSVNNVTLSQDKTLGNDLANKLSSEPAMKKCQDSLIARVMTYRGH